MIAATSNSTMPEFRSTTPLSWHSPVTSPGIPCHPDERLLSAERRIAGGLTEPESSRGDGTGASDDAPVRESGPPSGSVSPLVGDLLGSLRERAARARV